MNITINRFNDTGNSTLGELKLDGERVCFTLEDTHREVKVKGETRIAANSYKVALRTEGGLTVKYGKRYADMHKGMLHLQDVENFKYIYIHVGNDNDDTDGCILVGADFEKSGTNQMVTSSVSAYKNLYPIIAEAILRGEEVWCHIVDEGD